MDTLKTAVVVVLLLAVLYGVYVVLNKPEPMPNDLAWSTPGTDPAVQIELGAPQTAAPRTDAFPPASDALASNTNASPLPSPSLPAPTQTSAAPSSDFPAPSTITPPDLLESDRPAPLDASPSGLGKSSPPAWPPADETTSKAADTVPPTRNASGDQGSNEPGDTSPLGAVDQWPKVAPVDTPSRPAWPNPADTTTPVPESSTTDSDVAAATDVGAGIFQSVLQSIQTKLDNDEYYDALQKLSFYYNNPDLSPAEHQQLLDLLDPLAGKVIYSDEHLIEAAYEVQRGETLQEIADRHQVPWQLLANINGQRSPDVLVPGTRLKVVRGPFRAEVSLDKSELTLFLGKLYAGRFPITLGNDPAPQPGEYRVNDKQAGRTYYAGDGRTIAMDDPTNPYGSIWLDLGGDVCIHGSPESGPIDAAGCVSLSPMDANDIYGILSKGSTVLIRR